VRVLDVIFKDIFVLGGFFFTREKADIPSTKIGGNVKALVETLADNLGGLDSPLTVGGDNLAEGNFGEFVSNYPSLLEARRVKWNVVLSAELMGSIQLGLTMSGYVD